MAIAAISIPINGVIALGPPIHLPNHSECNSPAIAGAAILPDWTTIRGTIRRIDRRILPDRRKSGRKGDISGAGAASIWDRPERKPRPILGGLCYL